MSEGYQGKLTDLGPVHQGLTGHELSQINSSHVGGLAFGPDGKLYLCAMTEMSSSGESITHLHRFDTRTGELEDLGPLYDPELDQNVWYISRAVWISRQDIIGAVVGRIPTGIVHIHFNEGELPDPGDTSFPGLRLWG